MTLIPYTRDRATALDRWFDHNFFRADLWPSGLAVLPPIDARSDDDGLVVRLEVPGVAPERVSLEVKDRTLKLSIAAEAGNEKSGAYSRTFRIPDDLDTDKIEANLEYGVLNVRIPKAEAAKPRSVEIEIH